MKTTINFYRSENFWIDLGIATLFNTIKPQGKFEEKDDHLIVKNPFGKKDVSIYLDLDKLTIEGDKEMVEEVLKKIATRFKEKAWGETKKRKKWFTRPAEFFFSPPWTRKDIDTIFVYNPQQKNITCDICGQKDVPAAKKFGSTELPFVVTQEKMQTFYSGHKRKLNICASCSLAGRIAPFGIGCSYYISGADRTLNFFVLNSDDLISLSKALHGISSLFLNQEYGEFKHSLLHVQHASESFIDFVFNCWKNAKMRENFSKQFERNRFYICEGTKRGNVVRFQKFYAVPEPKRILGLIAATKWVVEKTGKTYYAFEELLDFMPQKYLSGKKKRIDTILREELCRRIIQGSEIASIIEELVYNKFLQGEEKEKGFYSINIRKFVESYECMVMRMEEDIIRNAKKIGEFLGELASEKEDKGILYSLRSARVCEDLLAVIHHTLTRYPDKVLSQFDADTLFSNINEKNFKKYKSLIGIYAILKFQRSPKR